MTGVRSKWTSMLDPIRKPTMMGYLRRLVLIYAPVPLPMLAIVAGVLGGELSAPGWTILLSGSASVASLLLCALVQPMPLPAGLSPEASVRRSLYRYRQVTQLRISLPMVALGVGFAAALIGGGMFPFLVALVVSWPQLLLALPGYYSVYRARRSMESWGGRAYLWAALAQPAPRIHARPAETEPRPAGESGDSGEQTSSAGSTSAGESAETATETMGTAGEPAPAREDPAGEEKPAETDETVPSGRAPEQPVPRPSMRPRPTGGPTRGRRASRARRSKTGGAAASGPRTPPTGIQIG